MRTLVFFICCLSISAADSLAEETEVASNKITATSKLNSIPSAPAQKVSQQAQYIPQYVLQQKPQQQPAMYILAQPGGAVGHQQGPLFQQAVHQLLAYYNNNPQARLQLLQQQGGVPQNTPQSPLPSGGLHVVPSPHLDQAPTPTAGGGGVPAGAQHVYAVPAQSQYALSPALLAQLTAQPAQPAQHLVAQQFSSAQHLPAQFFAQQIPAQQQFSGPQQQQQYPQFPAQFALAPQFAGGLGNLQLSQGHQFGLKQAPGPGQQFIGDFGGDKSQSSSSNYTPVFRTAYVKG